MTLPTTIKTFSFLQGGGEMGGLIRAYPWAQTPLGAPDTWPQSLRITLGILLHSAFPMFLFWGEELTCFYNDAYRPSLGKEGKHPAVGQPAKTVWPEIWAFIGPLIEQVMTTGEARWYEDQLVPIFRNGQLEDVYWTFSYSPAYNDDEQIAGVIVTCAETTHKVFSVNQLRQSEESLTRFKYMAENASDPFILMREDGTFAYLNQLALDRWGYTAEEARHLRVPDVDPIHSDAAFADVFARSTTGKLPPFDTLHRKKDGTIYPVEVSMGGLLIDGKPHLFAVARDITDRKEAEEALRASEQRFQAAVAAVQGILWTNNAVGEMKGEQPGWASLTGQRQDEYQDYGWANALHPDDVQPTIAAWEKATAQCSTFIFEHRVRMAAGHWELFSVRAIPLTNVDGSVREWVGVHTNITRQREAEEALRVSEARFRSLVEEAPVATMLLAGPGHIIELANNSMIDMLGKGSAILGKPAVEAVPELAAQTYLHLLNRVFTSGETYQAKAMPGHLIKDGSTVSKYFDFTYKPMRDAEGSIYGILSMAVDVTEQVVARQKIEANQRQLLALFEQSPVGIAIIRKENLTFSLVNPFYGVLTGRTPDELTGKPMMEALPELAGQGFERLLNEVIETDKPFIANEVGVEMIRQGQLQTVYVDLTYQPQHEADGSVSGVFVIAIDVTEQVMTRQKIEEAEVALRGAIDMAELGTWQIDLVKSTLDYSPRLRNWFGIDPDELITPERAYRPVMATDRLRVEAAIAHAIAPGSDGIYDIEYTVDPTEAGRERVLHIQGRTFFTDKGQAYRLSGTARDVTRQRRMQQELEQNVTERTQQLQASVRELERSNQNLQQFAYVASHDLQEPLRKIQSFGNLLTQQYSHQLGDGRDLLNRMQASASRMSTLIHDLLTFSRISTRQEATARVPLATVVADALLDLDLRIQETGAVIEVASLPIVQGDPTQLGQLFQNLLSNALKFIRPGVTPLVQITVQTLPVAALPNTVHPTREAPTYYRIDVVDNGIGFDEKYADRIFQVFQRLHGRGQFAGTGIGLAICEKVAANHGGAIAVASQPDHGATFSVYFPPATASA